MLGESAVHDLNTIFLAACWGFVSDSVVHKFNTENPETQRMVVARNMEIGGIF